MTTTTTQLTDLDVIAIDPARLDAMRAAGQDEHGNPFTAFPAEAGSPLRCCLRPAAAGESIALISYQPLPGPSPWAEVGPVYVHAERCPGYPATGALPAGLRSGPRVLRSYHPDGSLAYDHIVIIDEGDDIEAPLRTLLDSPEVAQVHVRALFPQCFTYAVRARH